MADQESRRNHVALRMSYRAMRSKLVTLTKDQERTLNSALQNREVQLAKIKSLKEELECTRIDLFWSKHDGEHLQGLMRLINKSRGDFACRCARCDRFDRHPKASLGIVGGPCSFIIFMHNTAREMQVEIYVCAAHESLDLVGMESIGDCSQKDADLVVSHDWANVYYGSRITSQRDVVSTAPITKVTELFDLPAMLSGQAPA